MAEYTEPMPSLLSDCGHCGECRWWQTDANAEAGRDFVGLCLHEELAHFELQLSAESGCNRFQPERSPALAGRAV